MYDLIIRNGMIYDGTGDAPFRGDVALQDGKVAAVGQVEGDAKEEIDASGKIVTPGFVDAHTHYDGQVTWDPYLQPSTFHGVTTLITGNCGVGFAPCKPEQRDWLIGLMEGVEDIPGTALHEGIKWDWETFPEYLDALEKTPLAIDVGTQLPHAALRAYVMGDRGPAHEPATPAEIDEMAAQVKEAIEAGALGLSTSRTEKHKDVNGVETPTLFTHEDELVGLAEAVGETGKGVLQGISDFYDFETEFHLFRRMAEASKRPISITVEEQDMRPEWWKQLLDGISAAQSEGLNMRGQVPPRATGVLQGLTATVNPFLLYPAYHPLMALPLEEKVKEMRKPEFRAAILEQEPVDVGNPIIHELQTGFHKMFRMGEYPDYEPAPEDSAKGVAEAEGRDPREVVLDWLLERDGHNLIYYPLFNYMPGNLDLVHEMLTHPYTTFGLGDGGAHCGALCDASFPTTLIQHWGRDRTRGPKLPLEKLVSMQTKETAELVGLHDRGILKPGYKADVNVIDFDRLKLRAPEIKHDLPAGGRRLVQRAEGYEVTIVNGQVAFREGEPVPGVMNGHLIRGAQPAPGATAEAAE